MSTKRFNKSRKNSETQRTRKEVNYTITNLILHFFARFCKTRWHLVLQRNAPLVRYELRINKHVFRSANFAVLRSPKNESAYSVIFA